LPVSNKKAENMRLLYWLIFLLSSCSLTSELSEYPDFKKIKFGESSAFIICRGTTTKSVLIAKKFNIKDRKITHCGIGLFNNGALQIFNVVDNAKKK
jgi:hypothetical protein